MKKTILVLSILTLILLTLVSCNHKHPDKNGNPPRVTIGIEGLEYTLNNDGSEYAVQSMGTCNTKEITLPQEHLGKPVRSIFANAFRNAKIEKIVIPEGYTEISAAAFEYCDALTSVSLPNTLTKIGQSAFAQCKNLKEIAIPDSVTSLGKNAFFNCTALEKATVSVNLDNFSMDMFENTPAYKNTSIVIDGIKYFGIYISEIISPLPENLVIRENTPLIPNSIFKNISTLKTVVIPDSVKSIGSMAFSGCSNLEEITIPDSVKFIANSAFDNTDSLQAEIYNYGRYLGNHLIGVTSAADSKRHSSFSIREGTVTVTLEPFFYGVEEVNIPASVEYIDLNFMLTDQEIKRINVHEDNPHYASENGILYNKDLTELYLCPNTTGVLILPETLEKICTEAFSYSSKNLSVVLPKSLKEIEYNAFRGISKRDDIKLYYLGAAEECPSISGIFFIGVSYYSEATPPKDNNSYWHYVDGVPTIWK